MYIALNTTIPCYSEIHVYAQCVDLDLQTIICLCFKMGFKGKRLKMMFLTRRNIYKGITLNLSIPTEMGYIKPLVENENSAKLKNGVILVHVRSFLAYMT